jgi:hypothetical protein
MSGSNLAARVLDVIERKKAGTLALLQNWAGTMEGYAKQKASWRDRTSHARQGLHSGVEQSGDQLTLYLSHGVEYGELLEKGTPPHIIKPKNKKALFWPGATHPVKLVRHPGTRSYAIVGPTMDAHISRIKRSVLDWWTD